MRDGPAEATALIEPANSCVRTDRIRIEGTVDKSIESRNLDKGAAQLVLIQWNDGVVILG
jgi:hypothetical protein